MSQQKIIKTSVHKTLPQQFRNISKYRWVNKSWHLWPKKVAQNTRRFHFRCQQLLLKSRFASIFRPSANFENYWTNYIFLNQRFCSNKYNMIPKSKIEIWSEFVFVFLKQPTGHDNWFFKKTPAKTSTWNVICSRQRTAALFWTKAKLCQHAVIWLSNL